MIVSANTIIKFQEILETDLKDFAHKNYNTYMSHYMRFRNMNGPQCPFCISAAKYIYMSEVNRKGEDFLLRFNNSNWVDYE